MENHVDVVVNGEIFSIRSTESVEYLQKLAHYAGKQMDIIAKRYAAVRLSERERTLLVALNIANDYYKVEPQLAQLTAEHKRLLNEHTKVSDENIKLEEEVLRLKRELSQKQAELDNKIVSLPLPDGRKAIS
ncbi:MAG: cell division protein ZapA [Defluviitaleaceae bacterium]|nr:cell division protein ZapA [Defluviitaleaceae bacterium]